MASHKGAASADFLKGASVLVQAACNVIAFGVAKIGRFGLSFDGFGYHFGGGSLPFGHPGPSKWPPVPHTRSNPGFSTFFL